MIKLSSLTYYVHMIGSILLFTSWWKVFQLPFKNELIYNLPLQLKFFVSNLMDIWTLQEVIVDQHYERVFRIPKNAIVLDIGGSIGDFSIFARKIRHAKQVHAYELDQERIALFKKNVALNSVDQVILHEKPALSLRTVFKECHLTHCEFMKVDCEGAEYQIFLGTPISILSQIQNISFEVHFFTQQMRSDYPKLKQLLTSAGFTLKEFSNPVHNSIGFLYASK